MEPFAKDDYMKALKKRSKEARITKPFQLTGLEIAVTLKDLAHKALYIKLAKEHNPNTLLMIAKDVASRRDVKNPGAYFMRLVQELPRAKKITRP